jgi:positive regulator of sigma E activity
VIGRVHAVSGREVLIAPAEQAACFGCLKSCQNGRVLVSAANPGRLPLRPGQVVETENSPPGLLSQSLAAILPLAAGFLAGFFLMAGLFPAAGEGPRAAAAALGLFLGGGLAFAVRRRHPPRETNRITRILAGESGPVA